MQRVMLFEEAGGNDRFVLGGKGYGLVEMTSIGLPVPPGFVITTEVCKAYNMGGRRVPDGLFDEVREMVRVIEERTGKRFGSVDKPLLFSVRSGAPFSMPGMMDTVLNLGLNDALAEHLAAKTSGKFAFDSYRRLIQMFGRVAMGASADKFEDILRAGRAKAGVVTDSELSEADLKEIVEEFKRSILTETGRDFPQDPFVQLELSIEAVLGSWNNPRAREYRKFYKISDELGTAVNIQAMVFGNAGKTSGSGVGFSRNPSTGEKKLFGEYLQNSQGEDVVAGVRTPVGLETLEGGLVAELQDVAQKLEAHFKDMQDFEFTIEDGRLYLLQTRNGKRTAQAAVRIAVEMAKEGLISKEEALLRVDPEELVTLMHKGLDPSAEAEAIAKGLDASPGAASGRVVFDTDEAAAAGPTEKVILVRAETTPEDIRGLIAAQGVLTMRGGMTSHAAVVARGMGKPAVVGCNEIEISPDRTHFLTHSGVRVERGEIITLDGTTGRVFRGSVPTVEPQVSKEFSELLSMADEKRRLGVWANADTEQAASKAREFGAEGIGLCRTERMFNAPNRLPIVREMIMSRSGDERRRHLYRLFPFQLADFKAIFSVMAGKPVVIRLLDLPLHEFLPSVEELMVRLDELRSKGASSESISSEEAVLSRVRQLSEHNPMLGHRGCRLAVTYPEIYEMQAKAILQAAAELKESEGKTVGVKIMFPLIVEAKELRLLKATVEEAGEEIFARLGTRVDFQVGTMIETPRAALTAGELARYSDFFSFGTNDLTQTTFAFSRDDVEAKFISKYLEGKILEESPFDTVDVKGVGRLVRLAVEEGRAANPDLEVGICGEHGGDPKSIAFFNEAGLDYVSCSAYRVPIARLAAAQAVLSKKSSVTTL